MQVPMGFGWYMVHGENELVLVTGLSLYLNLT